MIFYFDPAANIEGSGPLHPAAKGQSRCFGPHFWEAVISCLYINFKVDHCSKHKHHRNTYPVDATAREEKLWLVHLQDCVISQFVWEVNLSVSEDLAQHFQDLAMRVLQ